jgi:hypothetical protein
MAGQLNTRLPPQETFYNDATPVDNYNDETDRHDEDGRDSHDLALRADARTSVVDNMLLSLDQFASDPAALYSDFFLPDHPYQPPRATRHRGHTYASSLSSDYEMPGDDSSSRYSSHHSRGRRSNSSNNIPAMSRKSSLRGYPGMRDKQPSTHLGDLQETQHSRSSGKKISKGSSSSSMDFGHAGILGTHRIGLGRRSASFDQGRMAERSNMSFTNPDSILNRSRPTYHDYRDYDAAPEPTIPAGPRRAHNPPQSPALHSLQAAFAPPQAPALHRKNSMRSTSSRTLRKNKSQPEPNMRMQAQEFVNASTLRDLPRLPALQDPPAPSPTVATRKQNLAFPPTPVATPKEKPGFFRRVFGGSSKPQPQLSNSSHNSNNSHTNASPSASHPRTDTHPLHSQRQTQARPQTTPNGSQHIASQLKSLPKVPQAATSTQKEAAPPTLAKKHSSFFRRRKKSTADSSKMPIMSLDFRPPRQEIPLTQPSPEVSSLREVMKPYLNDLGSPTQKFYETREQQFGEHSGTNSEQPQGFSPGYKPHADSAVRPVKPGSGETDATPPSSSGGYEKAPSSFNTGSPKLKLKVRRQAATTAEAHDGSFLADSSSCNSGRATPSGNICAPEDLGEGKKHSDHASAQSGPAHSVSDAEDEDGWVVTSAAKKEPLSHRKSPGKSRRVWLEPTSSEERLDVTLSLPMEGAPKEKASPASEQATTPSFADEVFHSATSLPVVQVESRNSSDAMAMSEEEPVGDEEEPTEADRERARRLFNNEDPSVQKSQVAAILGDVTLTSVRMRKAYMELFDWTGLNILASMRDLCGRLVLKAETQQVDRILMSLSERWCHCNPNHGFKATGKGEYFKTGLQFTYMHQMLSTPFAIRYYSLTQIYTWRRLSRG